MAFQQFKLDRATKQTRDIFDTFVYRPDNGDTFAEIGDPNYFIEARFEDEILNNAVVYVYDGSQFGGYYIEAGVSTPIFGAALTPPEQDMLDSLLNLTPNTIPVVSGSGGTLEDSAATQDGEETIVAPEVKVNTNTLFLDSAWLIDSAGYGARIQNIGAGEDFNIMTSRFQKERHPGLVRVRNGNPLDSNNDFSLPINLVDTDVLTNPEYTILVPSITDEQGQTATTALVKIDPTSVLTNFVLEFSINGTLYTVFKEDAVTSGDYVFTYAPEIDIPVGSILNVKIFSTDGDVKLLGDSVSGIPFLVQDVQQYNDKEIYHLEDEVPTYKNANTPANELFINNAETIAADTDVAGAFTLSVDVNEVDWFNVFDFAGRWNLVSRRLTISLSNGDNYFLTRRNRKYFFYKDEQGVWQWYYTPYFLG